MSVVEAALVRVYGSPTGLSCPSRVVGAIEAFAHRSGHWHLVTTGAQDILDREITIRVPGGIESRKTGS